MPITPIKTSFNSGELSSSLFARVDIARYASGLRKCYNFLVHADGGASNRQGLKYRAEVKDSTKATILEEFVFSESQAYVLEFGEEYVRFYTPDGQITNSGTPYEVATPYQEEDLSDLRFESSADVVYIFHPSYQTRTLTRYGNANWVLDTYQPDDGPFMAENLDDGSSMSVAAVTGDTILTVSSVVDTNLVCLLHFDGIDESTTITDEVGHTFESIYGAHIETDQSKFGGSSCYFDGSNDFLRCSSDKSDFDPSGDFTIHFQYYRPTGVAVGAAGEVLFSRYVDADNYWHIYLEADETLRFYVYDTGSNVFTMSSGATTIAYDTWQHIEISRSGTTYRLFVDGVEVDSDTYATALPSGAGGAVYIGSREGISRFVYGYIDELVMTNEALHTSGFTPPTSATSLLTFVGDSLFSPLHVGALMKLRHYVEGQAISQAFSSATQSSSISCFTTWRLITHGTWTGKLAIEKSVDGGTTWTELRQFSSADDFNPNTSGTEDIETTKEPFLIRLNMSSYTSGTCNADLTSDPFYQEGTMRITSFINTTSVNVTILKDCASTADTTLWSEGAWSDYRGWPSYGRFFQDRLVTASTEYEPTTFWTTVTGNYTSYYRHQTLLATDAITDTIPGRRINKINGIIALKSLIFLTVGAECRLSLSDGVFTPTSYNKVIDGNNGSAGIEPVIIKNEALFMQKNNKVLRSIGYDFASDSFTGSDVNILARHMVRNKTITRIAYQQDPDSTIWCIRSDGHLLGCTYLREQDVVAWHEHETDGTIESIAIIPATTYDQVWLVVNRDGGRYVESFVERLSSTAREDQFFVDSGLSYDGTPVSEISGLDHLEGQVVNILADGSVHATRTVSSGSITLDSSYSVVHAGLGYVSDIETLNVEVDTRQGSLQATKLKIGNVTFRLIDTIGGYIGPDVNNLHEAFDAASLLSESSGTLGDDELFTGDIRASLGAGYSDGGRMYIRQSDPLPITLSGIIPEITSGGESS